MDWKGYCKKEMKMLEQDTTISWLQIKWNGSIRCDEITDNWDKQLIEQAQLGSQ